jgi:protein phosphatase
MATTVGVVCSIGLGPSRGGREHNGDNYLICRHGRATWRDGQAEASEPRDGHGTLAVVCDGMGDDDDLAATTTVRVLAKLYGSVAPQRPAPAMRHFILDAHHKLHERTRRAGRRLGSTITAVWILGRAAHWVQLGDSRLYLFRDGRLTQLTADHTRGEFARRAGKALPEEKDRLAQAFIFGSNGLGQDEAVHIAVGLDTGAEPLLPGDRLLLCTDGVHGVVDDGSLADVLRNVPEPQAAAVACMERAIARGGTDNVTAVVIRVDA